MPTTLYVCNWAEKTEPIKINLRAVMLCNFVHFLVFGMICMCACVVVGVRETV